MNTGLQIIVSAIDNASSVLQGVAGGLNSVASNTQSLFSSSAAASEQVVTALSLVGAAAVAAGGAIGVATMDTQAATVRLATTTADSIANANAAAEGHGTLGDMLSYATLQAALAKDSLEKLTASGKANSDMIDAAQMKYDLAAAKLSVLKGRMDDVGKSSEDLAAAQQKAIDAGTNLGFTVDDTTNALNVLQPMMGSKLAASALVAAENLSRMSNGTLDLSSAARMLGMAMETGMGKGLAQYGIIVKDGVGGTDLLTAAMEASKGQADTYANTLSGSLAVAWAHINQAMSDAGNKYMPGVTSVVNDFTFVALPALIKAINTTIDFIGRHKFAFELLAAGILATVIPAFVAWAVAAASAAIATAVALAPFFIAGVATAAIVAGIFWVVENWKTIWNGFKDWIGGLLDGIAGFFSSWYNKIMAFINPIINAVKSVGSMVGGIFSGAASAGSSLLTMVPHFASGGIVTGPTLALIGEAGPEAVVPLNGSSGFSGGGGGGNIIVNIMGGNYLDSTGAKMIARAVGDEIVRSLRLNQRMAI
jgi:hypothetical protein